MIPVLPILAMICFISSSISAFQCRSYHHQAFKRIHPISFSTTSSIVNESSSSPPLYLREGLLAVNKPLGLTSQDVVGKIRRILEADARARGLIDDRKRRRKPWTKVGHGGTLDPLATGVLVIGVGKGTKLLQKYLTGSKGYRAGVELGFQTTTLDLDPKGEVVATQEFDHVTQDSITTILPQFRGAIQQTPPIFSALKRNGKKLYELGRQGMTEEDIVIEPRDVQIHALEPIWTETTPIAKKFGLDVECGGGTYIRSLVRDIGISLGTVATMTSLERVKQGSFLLEHCLVDEKDWTVENICKGIEASEKILATANHDIL